jgi:hypothetical protein
MSIYCSTFTIGDEHSKKCARIRRIGKGVYQQDDSKECTCKCGPILYQGSHVAPSDDDKRGGIFSLGAIPGHIDGPKLKALGEDMRPYHPWLRVSIWEVSPEDTTILLTRAQVVALKEELETWLELSDLKSTAAKGAGKGGAN